MIGHTVSMQDDPYIDAQHEKRERLERERQIKHAAWVEGWRAGSRIGGQPVSPYRETAG
jgi:hypothetical protein